MRVTVCELPNERSAFRGAWIELAAHVRENRSELVLLPEMPFAPWFAFQPQFSQSAWDQAVVAHREAETQLGELGTALFAYTRPANVGGRRVNEGVVAGTAGVRPAHQKFHLPNEEPVWEASWYERGDGKFELFPLTGGKAGFLICTELWFFERARSLGQAGADLLFTPRKSDESTLEKWLVAGKAAAMTAGAFSLSANTRSTKAEGLGFGGGSWIINPEGDLLGMTTEREPFLTRDLDLGEARRAKQSYPRNVD